MTRDEIMAMEAGREMDRVIAGTVMGWRWYSPHEPNFRGERVHIFAPSDWDVPAHWNGVTNDPPDDDAHTSDMGCPFFSTSISDAWEVWEKLPVEPYGILLARCRVSKADECQAAIHIEGQAVWVSGDTAPLAICRAALLATLEERK